MTDEFLIALRSTRTHRARIDALTRREAETEVDHARRILAWMVRTPESVAAVHRSTLADAARYRKDAA